MAHPECLPEANAFEITLFVSAGTYICANLTSAQTAGSKEVETYFWTIYQTFPVGAHRLRQGTVYGPKTHTEMEQVKV